MNPRFSVSFISWIHEEFILRQSVLKKKKRRKRSIWNAYVNIKNNHFIVINGTNGRKSERRSRPLHCAHLLLAVFEGFDPATANPGRSYSPNFSGHGRYGITPQILPFRHRSSHAEGETTQERKRRPFHRLTGEGNARGRKTSEEDIKKKKKKQSSSRYRRRVFVSVKNGVFQKKAGWAWSAAALPEDERSEPRCVLLSSPDWGCQEGTADHTRMAARLPHAPPAQVRDGQE